MLPLLLLSGELTGDEANLLQAKHYTHSLRAKGASRITFFDKLTTSKGVLAR